MYIPAGVPVAGLSCGGEDGPDPTAPQATSPAAATSNNTNRSCGARHRTRPPEARSKSPARPITVPNRQSNGKTGQDPRGEKVVDAVVCGVVVIESVTVCGVPPGVIVADDANEAVAPAGRGDTLNVTGLENVPFEGDTVKANIAVCPAVTGGVELGGVTE